MVGGVSAGSFRITSATECRRFVLCGVVLVVVSGWVLVVV
jgi:hypothetical protein